MRVRTSRRHPYGRGAWLLALALLFSCGCSGRDRENPFDPLNPETGGAPAAARTRADCGRVTLSWDDLGMRDLAGHRIWRAEWHADETAALGTLLTPETLPAERATYVDSTVQNDQSYVYRVEYQFGADSAAAYAAPIEARPGGALAWSADPCGWGLALLTPDAGAVERLESYGTAVLDLDVDPLAHRLFAAQIDSGQVLIYRSDGPRIAAVPVAGASCVSWSAGIGALAVGAFYEQRVVWITPQGETLWSLELGAEQHPEDLAFRDSSTTWIAVREGVLLRAGLGTSRAETLDVALERPVAIAEDPGRGCWVADRGGDLVYVSDQGDSWRAAPGQFDEPLDVDAVGDGSCWVADLGRGAVVRVDREAQVLEEIGGLSGAAGVTYDPLAAALWVALPERGEVLLRSLSDGWTRRILIGGCPRKVAGDWDGRCRATLHGR
ncbi:MAG: hypothetical protein GF330_01785 [Candidatus Eisenbacteria bacterium]|nr:hypothetical protein [Candidatus Eisenbacteria bacterium]